MQIREGKKVYRVRGPDGWWLKKSGPTKFYTWVEVEQEATIWKSYNKLRKEIKTGILSRIDEIVGIIDIAHLRIFEYTVEVKRTGVVVRAADHADLKEKSIWDERISEIGWKK